MNKRILVSMGAALLFSAFAAAQSVGPTFTYTSGETVDHDYSAPGSPALDVHNMITVPAYLYIKGTLGSAWTVSGWGAGNDTQMESVKFYHNEILTLVFTTFGKPAKTSGTSGGDQTCDLDGGVVMLKDSDNTVLDTAALGPIGDLNTHFASGSAPTFDPVATGGTLRMEFTRKIYTKPTTGPGVYENHGTITVNRS